MFQILKFRMKFNSSSLLLLILLIHLFVITFAQRRRRTTTTTTTESSDDYRFTIDEEDLKSLLKDVESAQSTSTPITTTSDFFFNENPSTKRKDSLLTTSVSSAFEPVIETKSSDVNRITRQDLPHNSSAKTQIVNNKPKAEALNYEKEVPKWLLFNGNNNNDSNDNAEYEGYNGWYNNRANPQLGAVDTPLVRLLAPKYSDGVYRPSGVDRENPIFLSEAFMKGEIGNKSTTGKTAFFVFFGQQVVEEILDAQSPGCPPEYFNVNIPKEVYAENGSLVPFSHSTGHTIAPFLRTRYNVRTGQSTNNPRQQLNEVTPWIDGGLIYGTSKGWSDNLRSFKDGRLSSFSDGSRKEFPVYNDINLPLVNFPPPSGPHKWSGNVKSSPKPRLLPVNRFFRLGNPRGHENPFLLTMGIIWFRWHNVLADELRSRYPKWTDNKIYNEARKWVIASHQRIVVYEWLPMLLGHELPEYKGYDGSIDPQISHVFQSAAFRFGHTLVTAGGIKRNRDCSQIDKLDNPMPFHSNENIIRTCNSYWKPIDHLLGEGFEKIIMGMTSQPAEKEDNVVVEDLRGNVFGPLEFTRRDLMAINIQRGRDHGLPDYLTARRELGLDNEDMSNKSIEDIAKQLWKDNINQNPMLLQKAIDIYNNKTDKIDIWVGGLLETTTYQPGPLFRHIISDQFRRIRDGDRFWFENDKNRLFTKDEISRLKELTLYDIIRSITDIKEGEIQPKVFRLPTDKSNPISSECTNAMKSYSYECVTDIVNGTKEMCLSLGSVNQSRVMNDKCTIAHTFDYFEGSEVSYALTFVAVGVFAIICVAVLRYLVDKKLSESDRLRKDNTRVKRMTLSEDITLAQEWVGKKENLRAVQIHCRSSNKCISVKLESSGRAVRSIDLKEVSAIQLQASTNRAQDYLLIKVAKEYDLVLKFDSYYDRERFASKIELFLEEIGVGRERLEIDLKSMLDTAYTKMKRQKHLEQFFRVVFSHAFGVNTTEDTINVKTVKEVINTELTQYEFAEALSLRSDSTFIQQMFALVDKDNNGYISFREFLDMIVIFAKGTADQKAKLMFDMYDVDTTGKLTVDEFKNMIKSMLELANQSISPLEMDEVIESMFKTAGLKSRQELTFEDFQKLLGDYKEELGYAELNFDVSAVQGIASSGANRRQSAMLRANNTLVRAYSYFGGNSPDFGPLGPLDPTPTTKTAAKPAPSLLRVETQERNKEPDWLIVWKRIVDEYKLQIFWITIYTALILFIFLEKAYTYTFLREHGGLRQIAGLGVTITRGAASVQMFCYSTILLTMCRNIITFLRETFLHRFVPFDDAVVLHKYIAFWALIMSIIHSIGHAVNFYHISTQTADDATCLFREFYHSSDELPKFHNWCWQTITGITGVSLLCLVILMYVFAIHYSRRHIFNAFWATHNLYPILYILMILHGLGRIVQSPIFYHYFIIPIILFTIDRLISVSRKKVEISVISATLHPSDVTHLEFKRPPSFDYKSGQWVRIACLALNSSEYHPFTIASAPHEDNLSLFIRAVGPFTKNLRQTYDPNNLGKHAYPKLYLDGPYGEGHQDWLRFDVAVLVGGGIGVTPFASILKDIAFRAGLNTKINCKKVYFLWVTRTQKHFEWLSDVIRDTEEKDKSNLLTTHIFITQFYEKFDLRTTMLYICERHFQRISNRSLFTGLKAKTHFGRPNFTVFLDSLQQEHPNVTKVGVFSCGPGPMTNNVQQSCETLNRREGAIFVHHFENF